jgi:hypothetical protein
MFIVPMDGETFFEQPLNIASASRPSKVSIERRLIDFLLTGPDDPRPDPAWQ